MHCGEVPAVLRVLPILVTACSHQPARQAYEISTCALSTHCISPHFWLKDMRHHNKTFQTQLINIAEFAAMCTDSARACLTVTQVGINLMKHEGAVWCETPDVGVPAAKAD